MNVYEHSEAHTYGKFLNMVRQYTADKKTVGTGCKVTVKTEVKENTKAS